MKKIQGAKTSWIVHNTACWEVEGVVSLADAPLARFFRVIIQCDGKVHSHFCMEKQLGCSKLRYTKGNCAVQLIISLPIGSEKNF